MNELLVAAREYRVRHGWSTIPVVDKDAVVKWSRYQRTKPREAELVNWFGNGNHFTDIAVIMGKVSGGLCCRDFDDPPTYKAWYDHFPDLADSLSTSFGREGHANVYCIAKPESFKAVRQTLGCKGTGAIALGDGKLRGDVGCITVLPPSKHPDGHQYRWRGPWHQIPAVDLRAAGFVPASAIKRASAHKQLPESAVIAKSAVSVCCVPTGVLPVLAPD